MDQNPNPGPTSKRKLSLRFKMPRLPVQANGDANEPMELDVESDELTPVIRDVSLDLESYICHYDGLPKIHRLEFIAEHCISLRIEALTMAINYIKDNTYNVVYYRRLFKKLQEAHEKYGDHGRSGGPAEADAVWIDTKTKQALLRQKRLENDLKNFRSNSMKENIRRGQDDLGDHYLDCGELRSAINAYSESRDFIITHRNQINQCLNVIRVGVLLELWSTVSEHAARAQSQPNNENPTNPVVANKLHCAAGLVELNSRKYKKAAKHFLSTNFDHFQQAGSPVSGGGGPLAGGQHGGGASSSSSLPPRPAGPLAGPSGAGGILVSGSGPPGGSGGSGSAGSAFMGSFNMGHHERELSGSASQWEVLAPVNIAVYGSLCALATYSRQELANQLINSASFKQFAELEPQLREAVARFHESKYAACLAGLQELKNVLFLDMYLAPHVERLYQLIRHKALTQYFEPYSKVDMHKMARAFNTTTEGLETELIALIQDGHIKARIDSHNKVLYAKSADPRTLTFERALQMGKQWQRQTQALISRTAILNAGLLQEPAGKMLSIYGS